MLTTNGNCLLTVSICEPSVWSNRFDRPQIRSDRSDWSLGLSQIGVVIPRLRVLLQALLEHGGNIENDVNCGGRYLDHDVGDPDINIH